MNNHILTTIINKVKNKEEISPFLFVSQNLELLNNEITKLVDKLFNEFKIPKSNFFILKDNGEKIKIEEIKNFLFLSKTTTPYKFQVFFIENIGRMTLQASNSCLKFFEEPWVQNIILASTHSEGSILETIISRVQSVNLSWDSISKKDNFYYSLIDVYLNDSKNFSLISYVFNNKLKKEEQIKILENMYLYMINKLLFIDQLSLLQDDIDKIKRNNVLVRSILDKWILKISNRKLN